MKYLSITLICAGLWAFALPPIDSGYTYTKDIRPLMDTFCIRCHGDGMNYYPFGGNLKSYDSLKVRVDNGTFRERVLVKKDMPRSSGWHLEPGLAEAKLLMLDSWLRAGAPE
ncbi:MAG: hypothetical protein JNL57_06130 [Bacteroidetes bacterium]|nr:hypothetical protein [Bacteroidota bacterium]